MSPSVQFETDLADLLRLQSRVDAAMHRSNNPSDPKVLAADEAFADAHLAFVAKWAPK